MEYIKVRVKWFHEYDNPLVTDTRPDVQLNQDGHVTSTYCLFFLGFPGKMHSRGGMISSKLPVWVPVTATALCQQHH